MRIINPVVFGVMLIVLRLVVPSEFISGPTVYPSFSVNTRLVPPAGGNLWHLAYTPNTALTNRIVKRAAGLINAETEAGVMFQNLLQFYLDFNDEDIIDISSSLETGDSINYK